MFEPGPSIRKDTTQQYKPQLIRMHVILYNPFELNLEQGWILNTKAPNN